jgi:hypothetical protein
VKVDHNDFRQRFAELSDAGLLSMNRDELVDVARQWYDFEVSRRGLRREPTFAKEPKRFLSLPESWMPTIISPSAHVRMARTSDAPGNARRLLGAGFDLVRHFLTATVGTVIAESSIYAIYHPKTLDAVIAKEIILSAVVALVLGAVVQQIWQSNLAKWMALLGVLMFATTLRFEPTSVLEAGGSFRLAPIFEPTDLTKLILGLVSVRLIAYSFGAFCWATFGPKKAAQVQPHPVEQATE